MEISYQQVQIVQPLVLVNIFKMSYLDYGRLLIMVSSIARQNILGDNKKDKLILTEKDMFLGQMQKIIFIKERLLFIMMMARSKIYYLKMGNLLMKFLRISIIKYFAKKVKISIDCSKTVKIFLNYNNLNN